MRTGAPAGVVLIDDVADLLRVSRLPAHQR